MACLSQREWRQGWLCRTMRALSRSRKGWSELQSRAERSQSPRTSRSTTNGRSKKSRQALRDSPRCSAADRTTTLCQRRRSNGSVRRQCQCIARIWRFIRISSVSRLCADHTVPIWPGSPGQGSLSLSLSLSLCVCVCVCVSVRLCVCVLQPTLPIYSAACALVVHRSASNSHDDLSEYAPPCNSRTSSETSRSRKPRSSASE